MISLIDLLPTAYDVAGLAIPGHVQGHSVVPLAAGRTDTIREHIFAEVNFHAAYEPMRCVRTPRYKYIRRYDHRRQPVLPNMDDGPSKTFLLEAGWAERRRDQEMLFDLVFDPAEADNLIERAEYRDVREDLSAHVDSWMTGTDDPILQNGTIDLPAGCVINDVDGLSPNELPQTL